MGIGDTKQFEGCVKPDSISVDSYEPDLCAKRYMEVPSNLQMRIDYHDGGLEEYIGYAPKGLSEDGDDDANGWLLHYLEYDVNSRLVKRTIAYGNWTQRTTASYS